MFLHEKNWLNKIVLYKVLHSDYCANYEYCSELPVIFWNCKISNATIASKSLLKLLITLTVDSNSQSQFGAMPKQTLTVHVSSI